MVEKKKIKESLGEQAWYRVLQVLSDQRREEKLEGGLNQMVTSERNLILNEIQ